LAKLLGERYMLARRKIAHPVCNGEHARPDAPANRRPFRLDLGDRRDLTA
jgi:hypothetical protein